MERRGDRVLLRDLGSATGSRVNGMPVRDALLSAGDQVAFDGQHRFVVEVPWVESPTNARQTAMDVLDDEEASQPLPPAGDSMRRWPWLLLAALLLAATLSALLLFGAG